MADNLEDEDNDYPSHLDVINQFNEYRGQAPWTNSDIDKYWRKRLYQYPNPPAVAAPPFPGWQNLAGPSASPVSSQREEAFLEQTIPEITADPAKRAHWKGIKYLGGGGGGRVGLWEYTGPGNTATNPRRVAVKEVRVDNQKWDSVLQEAHFDEGKRLERLQAAAQSSHIITLQNPLPEADAKGKGKVRRLVFEYCDMGDLLKLIDIRRTSRKPLKETSLWQLFNCLVDGLSVLEFGAEHSFKPNSNTAECKPASDWERFIHFDLKPPNILLKDERFTHSITPLCKIADFGLTKTIKDFDDSKEERQDSLRYEWRNRTTPGYFAPEQFTEQWEYINWEELGIAGNYGPAMNVWGMGIIMYQLVTLERHPFDITQPYTPLFNNGEIAKGLAFGIELRSYPYSQHLLDLITECLYEHPKNRPTIARIKESVRDGFNAAVLANGEVEPWADFLPAPPPPPPPPPSPSPSPSPSPPPPPFSPLAPFFSPLAPSHSPISPPAPPAHPAPPPAPAGNANNINANANANANNNANAGAVQNAAAPQAAAALVVGTIINCQHIKASGIQCGRKFRYTGTHIYCKGSNGHLKLH